jgi:CDGSH-type Zn-finger protein
LDRRAPSRPVADRTSFLVNDLGRGCHTLRTTVPGKYFWCACGRSRNQPFCDGSHAGTGISPEPFELEKEKRVALCQCKRTGKPPMCDGTHSSL